MADEKTFPADDKGRPNSGEPSTEATGPDDFDGVWKHMVDRFLPDFLRLFHPEAYADIDWERGVESLDKDLKKLRPKAKASSRWADKLLKVWRRSSPAKDAKDFVGSEPGLVYLHMEFQNQRASDLPERMFVTSYRVFDRHRCPVVGLVVLGQKGSWDLEPSFGWRFWGGRFEIEFPVVKLWEYNEPKRWAELEAIAETNPAAVLTMAHLKAMATQNQASSRYAWKLALFRRLLASHYERHDIEALLDFVDWLMQLPEPFEEQLDKEVEEMEATKRVPYTTPWERRGIKKGRKEGLQKGLQKGLRLGKAGLLKSLSTQRFGELSDDVVERIDRADLDTLDRWSRHLLDAKRLEDIFDDEIS